MNNLEPMEDRSADALVSNIYYTGAHYDLRYADYDRDIQYYVDLSKRLGPNVLELAVGTGRLAIPIVLAGCKLTGLDINRSMLNTASEKARSLGLGKAQDISFVVGDMTEFDLGNSFDLCILACSSLSHVLNIDALHRLLKCVRRSLRPGGWFALDTATASDELISDYSPRFRFRYNLPDGEEIVVMGRREYDAERQIIHDFLDYLGSRRGSIDSVHRVSKLWPAEKIEEVLTAHSFITRKCSYAFSETGTALSPEHLILVCQLKHSPE